ncbi:MAG: hypothetical protein AB1508_18945 [Pseudomonadota bacterium]
MSVFRTITDLSAATEVQHSDLFMLVRETESASADKNKKVTKAVLDFAASWTQLAPSAYTATPAAVSETSSVYTTIPDWTADTAVNVGEFMKPTATNGYVYECIASAGDNKTHATTEPVWPTVLGDEIVDDQVTWRCRGANVIGMAEDLTALIYPGMPLRYVFDSVTYYGICLDISATYMAVAGAPLYLNESLTALYYGPSSRAIQVNLFKAGDYDNGADVRPQPQFSWLRGPACLVYYKMIHETNDTGASGPFVNMEVAGAVVSADGDGLGNPDKGTQPTTSWTANSPVAIKVSAYTVNWGDEINPTITTAGSNGDATGLSVNAIFVLQ